MKAIEIQNLVKTYGGGVQALKGIDLSVERGEFFGLLGPNGAGKSTTIGVISSLVLKTSGQVEVCGKNIDTELSAAKQYLGVVPQEFNFNQFEMCEQIVMNQAGYYGVLPAVARQRTAELFEQLGLSDKAKSPSRSLSGGMKRRLMIARALVHQPQVLILDEPTAGVDISLRRSMWTFLTEANKNGLTIILTTHYLEEAEALCERIAIIDQGEIIENAPTNKLLQKLSVEAFLLYGDYAGLVDLPELGEIQLTKVNDEVIEAELPKDVSMTDLMRALSEHGIEVDRMRNKTNRLEELFLRLVEK